MKKKPLFIATLSILGAIGLGSGYYYNHTHPAHTGKQHGVGIKDLSCSDSVVFSLRLKLNGQTLWTRSDAQLFNMPEAVPTQDRRFPGKHIMPLAALLTGHDKIKSVEAIPCDGKPVALSAEDILQHPDIYYIGQNRKNRLKLLKYIGDRKYLTLKRNLIDINLVE